MKNSTKEQNMTTQFTTKRASQILFIGLITICCAATLAPVHAQRPEATKAKTQYQVSNLPSLGGTSSAGNSINNQTWAAGYSRLTGDQTRHAALWRSGVLSDLDTLGGPNSSVTWNVKNTAGVIVGISQTLTPEPLGEIWSSFFFYSGPFRAGYINLGFVWEQALGQMRGLPNFPGGNNGFATGANNLRQVVGWAENGVHDGACVSPQVLQFRPAMWTLGPPDQIQDLPLIPGDTSGAATAINDNGQIVGISGICDQAVGRHTARHAVLWENGGVTDLGNLGAQWWNTPTAINQRGDVVGFDGDQGGRHSASQTVAGPFAKTCRQRGLRYQPSPPGSRHILRRELYRLSCSYLGSRQHTHRPQRTQRQLFCTPRKRQRHK